MKNINYKLLIAIGIVSIFNYMSFANVKVDTKLLKDLKLSDNVVTSIYTQNIVTATYLDTFSNDSMFKYSDIIVPNESYVTISNMYNIVKQMYFKLIGIDKTWNFPEEQYPTAKNVKLKWESRVPYMDSQYHLISFDGEKFITIDPKEEFTPVRNLYAIKCDIPNEINSYTIKITIRGGNAGDGDVTEVKSYKITPDMISKSGITLLDTSKIHWGYMDYLYDFEFEIIEDVKPEYDFNPMGP